ncbi:MAG: DUF4011 domain-containing protein [Gammaproteobacteria bacterium]
MRPYFHKNATELTAIYEESVNDLEVLRQLLAELEQRNAPASRQLKIEVANRLPQLMTNGRTDSAKSEAQHERAETVNPNERPARLSVPPDSSGSVDQTTASHGDDAAAALSEIREKLLDLTRRNPLLNYRHPRGRSLRVIDEVPDQLFTRLLNGDAFVFEPLPRVPLQHDAMPEKTREFLESQSSWHRPARNEWARMHDIEPGFELPVASTRDKRHEDLVIQTLLFPDELETRLRAMAANARTAIEESGANILNLAFGFLEWRETDQSETKSLAPLILVPVALKKTKGVDSQTRRERFQLEYSGEDMQSNISLREKLSDFSLVLPNLEEEDTPASYFHRCSGLLEEALTWTIHRFVTLGFFQFGKLLMYLDLDPDRWPDDAPIAEHLIVKQVLEGASDGGIGGGSPIDIDKLPLDAPEAQTVESADSSQHQAIIDAAAGRNMVIEGPPGTGKSQTITNIIGVCLAKGKSVLFVSEKLAALEVVRSRLEKAGLGDFCLELHSHKTQKRKFLDDLEKRVKRRRQGAQGSDSKDNRKAYKDIRTAIADYLKAIRKIVDGYGFTRQELFCKVAQLGSGLPEGILASIATESQGTRLGETERTKAINFAKGADRVRSTIEEEYGNLSRHPWYGLIPLRADAVKADGKRCLENWLNETESLIRHAFGSDAAGQTSSLQSPGELGRALETFHLLDRTVCDTFNISKVAALNSPTSHIAQWIDQESRLLATTARAASMWKLDGAVLRDIYLDIAAATELLDAGKLALSKRTAREVARIARFLCQLTDQLEEVAQGMLTIEETLGCQCDPGEEGIRVAGQLLTLAIQRPTASLSIRQPILESIRDLDLVAKFVAQHQELVKTRARLSLQFKLDEAVDENRIKAAESILLKATGLFHLQSDWRSANTVYQSLRYKKAFFRSTTKKASDLQGFLHYLREKSEFERNTAYAGLLGPVFAGLETPADDIWQLCTWYRTIREVVSDEPTSKGIAGQHLMSLNEKGMATFDTLAASSFRNTSEFVVGRLRKIAAVSVDTGDYIFAGGWKNAVERAKEVRDRVVHAADRIALHCVDPSSSVEHGQDLLQATLSLQTDPGRLAFHNEYLLQQRRNTWSESDIHSLRSLMLVARIFEQEPPQSTVISACIEHATSAADAREKTNEVGRVFERFMNARKHVDALFAVDETKLLGQAQETTTFKDLAQRLKATQTDDNCLSIWTDLVASGEQVCTVADVPPSVQNLLVDAEQGLGLFTNAIAYMTLAWVADDELRRDPLLNGFSSDQHDERLQKFRQLDERLRLVSSRDIFNRLLNNHVPAGKTGTRAGHLTDMALLNREILKQRGHVPIRKLVERAGNALIALKPCFMMGPLSVSQYLSPGLMSFDLVVMDEASQMRPEDALGAIARGKQLIVVGDPKQLPPTSFFSRLNEYQVDDDENGALNFGSQESILDIAAPLFGASRLLSWHYRSQHEDLIAFSNHSFYDNSLLLFPTAHAAADHLGLSYHRVKGTYSNRTNEHEAQQLITDVVHEIKSGRKRSIGIVSINSQQAQVLRDIWDRNIREMPEIEEILGSDDESDVLDSLFIKNLENVQGDERDVIFISLTYGRDLNGNFYQRFGPINMDVGWRRLNVLLTRAKQQMRVYSSMDSSMIVPGDNAKRGVIALKDFLSYCETKVLPERPIRTGREPDSPFEVDVAAEVQAFGLEIEFQVGVAGFFIDIGVYDPRETGHYLMGIECDGATYHSSQSARDRDKIRQEILEGLGWRIYRIWSTDWFHSRLQERGKLRDALKAARLEADSRADSRTINAEAYENTISGVGLVDDQEEATQESSVHTEEVHEERSRGLRSRFLELRKTLAEEFPDVRPEHSLLSDDVLAVLLRHRPVSLERFHQTVPLELRQKIDLGQSRAYLSTIMLMLEDG